MPSRRALLPFVAVLLLCATSWTAPPASALEVARRTSFALGDDACDDVAPKIAAQPDGSFLAVWQRCYFPTLLRAQRLDALGRKLGAPIDLGEGLLPQVVPLPDRGFALAYLLEDRERGLFTVHARRLASTGLPLGAAVRLDETTESTRVDYSAPRLSVAPDGRLFAAWRYVFLTPIPIPISQLLAAGRLLDANAQPAGSSFELGYAGLLDDLDVSFDEEGRAIAVLALGNVAARRFDASGIQVGSAVDVSGGGLFAANPRLAPRRGGGWWMVWEESEGGQSVVTKTFLRALGPDGGLAGPRIDVGLIGNFAEPVVALDPDALVLVAGRAADGSVTTRLFEPSGAAASNLLRTAGPDPRPLGRVDLAPASPSGFTAIWEGDVDYYPPPPVAQAGWDLRGATLAASCPNPAALCARLGDVQSPVQAQVEVRWKLGALAGTGRGLRLGRHLLFALENPGRFDVAVDLLGGAIDWAATTNAEVEIRWTEGGATLVAQKPRGPFRSGHLALPAPTSAPLPAAAVTDAILPEAPPPTGTCAPSATSGCLFDGRFRVSAFSTGADGVERAAQVLAYADRQVYFDLPGAAGGAALSVVDGRSKNGKIWVYVGGLSDASFHVEVTDVTTGASRTYSNAAGQRQSRADRQAF